MNIGMIAARVGTSLLKNIIPGAGLIIDTVNAFLPEDQKLDSSATGQDLTSAVNSLPPEHQAQVLSKEFDVEIAEIESHAKIVEALSKADTAGSSTRPKIALMMAWLLTFSVSIFIGVWAISIGFEKVAVLKELNDSWPMILAVLGPVIALLRSYFGMRSGEKKARYSAVTQTPPQGNFLMDIVKAFKG